MTEGGLQNPYLLYFLGVTGLTITGILLLQVRIRLAKARGARRQRLGRGIFFPLILWGGGGIVMLFLAGEKDQVLIPAFAYLGSSGLATFVHLDVRKRLKQAIDYYYLTCPKCSTDMELVGEQSDDQFLSPEEIAQERSRGLDFEFWKCEMCSHVEKFIVGMEQAAKCPKCGLKTVTKKLSDLDKDGKEGIHYNCRNPKCDYEQWKDD